MKRWVYSALLIIGFLVGACSSGKKTEDIPTSTVEIHGLIITSSAFHDGETIPPKYTCDTTDTSPDLHWSGVPAGVKSLALIVDDLDAPNGTWVHWVLFNIPPELADLPAGVQQAPIVEGTGIQGKNSSGNDGYNGPCPPKGKPHHYYFKVYALDIVLDLISGSTKAQVEKAMVGHILAQGQLVGTYGR